jgi:hypothetical protein
MGISSAVSAVYLVFLSVVAFSYNCPAPASQIIYNLPDKRLELKSEINFAHFQKVSLNSF